MDFFDELYIILYVNEYLKVYIKLLEYCVFVKIEYLNN